MYACEVSTEALPQENLKIEGTEVQYDVNDKINISCKSGDGRPLPDLSWFINDNMASFEQLIFYPPQTNADGLQSTKLGLVFLATPNYFHRGVLKLRCTATLTLVYEFEAVEYVIGGTAKNKSQVSSYSWSKDWSLQPDRATPIIEGVKQKYHVNDILNMNCTSSAHDAQLKWYINDDEANSSQLIRYNSEETNSLVLGLRFSMEQYHFQMQELKLRCVALFRRTIADFQEQFDIRTLNQEVIEAQSANVGIHTNLAEPAKYCGLTYILATIVIFSMQTIYLEG